VWKLPGDENIGDLGTKVLDKARFEDLLRRANVKRMADIDKIPESKVVGGIRWSPGVAKTPELQAVLAAVFQLLQPFVGRTD
jgi:hypothetical protein